MNCDDCPQVLNNEDGTVSFHAKTKKKDDESKFFIGFNEDGSVSSPELTTNDECGKFSLAVVGTRHK